MSLIVMRLFRAIVACVACLCTVGVGAAEIDRFADLGDTTLYAAPDAKGVVLLLADAGSMPGVVPSYAAQLNAMGYAVAAVNIDTLFAATERNHATCLNPVTLLDVYSQHLQDRFQFAEYHRPLVIGVGHVGAFAYLLMHQAPRNMYLGVVSQDFCPELRLPAAPCGPPYAWKAAGGNLLYLQPAQSLAPWVLIDQPALQCAGNAKAIAEVATRTIVDGPDALRAAVAGIESAAAQRDQSTDDLPLVELPLAHPRSDYFAIIVSGDGGWANIDKDIGEELNRRGVPVVGWNALQYFWSRKTPEQAAADLGRVIAHYGVRWGRKRVKVVGFSLGADVLPFMLSRLPPEQHAAIDGVALLSPGRSVDFEFHLGNWIGGDSDDERPITPELAKLHDLRIQCFYGEEDADSVCPDLSPARFAIIREAGDHHFNGDYRAIADELLRGVEKVPAR